MVSYPPVVWDPALGLPPGMTQYDKGDISDIASPPGNDVTFNDPSNQIASQTLSNNGGTLDFTVTAGSSVGLANAATWSWPLRNNCGLTIPSSVLLLPVGAGIVGLNTVVLGSGVVILCGISNGTDFTATTMRTALAGVEFTSATQISSVSTGINTGSVNALDIDSSPSTTDVARFVSRPLGSYGTSDSNPEAMFRTIPYLKKANNEYHSLLRSLANQNIIFLNIDTFYFSVAVIRNAVLGSPASFSVDLSTYYIGEPAQLR